MKCLFYIVSLVTVSCAFGQDQSALLGCWADSREENVADSDLSVYRPCEFKFPPSRFRFEMDLREKNQCAWLYLAPDDGHYMKEGTWTYDEKTGLLLVYDSDHQEIKRMRVESADPSLLKVRILPQP